MPVMEPFEGAKSENNEQQKALLGVIAQSGAAGKAAYQAARDEANKSRQGALDRAGQRANITGMDFGGVDTAPVHETADRFNTYFTGQEAAFQNNLNAIGASSDSYLGKINAIAPFIQSENVNKAADRENTYKQAIAQAQAQIDADKAAAAAAHERDKELINLRGNWDLRTSSSGGGGGGGGRAPAAPKAPTYTPQQLIGLAQGQPSITRDTGNILGQAKGNPTAGAGNLVNQATTIGKGLGVGDNVLAGLNSPDFLQNLAADLGKLEGPPAAAVPPPGFDKGWVMSNVIMPGTDKKATSSRADEVMRAPEVQQAREFVPVLATLQRTGGRITDSKAADNIRGKTPREAFELWLGSVPGIRTMKDALRQYYGPWLDSLR